MKIQNAFQVFGHLATVWTSRLTAFAYLPSSSQVGGQVWMSQGPSLDFSLTCGEQLTCFRQLCFQQHVMSLSCTYLEALSSSSFSAATICPTKHFPEQSHPGIYHALFLLLKSPAHISSAHMIQHCWQALTSTRYPTRPELLFCYPNPTRTTFKKFRVSGFSQQAVSQQAASNLLTIILKFCCFLVALTRNPLFN